MNNKIILLVTCITNYKWNTITKSDTKGGSQMLIQSQIKKTQTILKKYESYS